MRLGDLAFHYRSLLCRGDSWQCSTSNLIEKTKPVSVSKYTAIQTCQVMIATVDASAEIKSGIHPISSNRFFSFVRFDTRAISKYENPLVRSQISPDQLLDSVTLIGSYVANGSVNGCLSPSGISVGDGTIATERNPQQCNTKCFINPS